MRRFASVMLGVSMGLVLATAAHAQAAIGVRGGFNSSSVTIKVNDVKVEGLGSRSGFHAGAEAAFMVSPMFAIEIGGQYSQKGFKEDATDEKAKLDYIDVPLVVAVNVPTNSQITPRIFAGGVGSFEMSCKLVDGDTSEDCTDASFPRKKSYFSAIAGAGIAVAAGPGSFIVQAAYQLGLTNIADEEGVSAKGNAIQASVGYRYNIGG
ncbi:MAG: PorT family protein [Gemmatimonadota bacterium]|nr:MAG: PorT family protein [Gemmatimonadota bacterium]